MKKKKQKSIARTTSDSAGSPARAEKRILPEFLKASSRTKRQEAREPRPSAKKRVDTESAQLELLSRDTAALERDLQYARSGARKITLEKVLVVLSELLALEQGKLKLYVRAAERAKGEDLRSEMRAHLRRVERHSDRVQTAIRDLGGNPFYVSPSAEIQRQRIAAAMELAPPKGHRSLADLESILLVESRSKSYQAFLESIIPFLEDPHAQDCLQEIVDRLAGEKQDRLQWAEQTLVQLSFEALLHQPVRKPATARVAQR